MKTAFGLRKLRGAFQKWICQEFHAPITINVPVKFNPGEHPQGQPQDYARGTSDHTGDSDNSSSFRYHSDVILALQIVDI